MENDDPVHPIDENNGEMGKALEDCIGRLKEIQKKCVLAFYYESLCYKEIADSMALDINKVKSHIQNGKRNLKLCLEEKNETQKER
jgi:RNA polymerase sigma-70 factor (ECF subfamily)